MLNSNSEREKPPTLLLIDDDMVSREVMATVLTMSGFMVHTAPDGTASLEMLAGGVCVPDVILMDAQMPGLSGTQLIRELRARSQAALYAMSGSNAPAEVAAAADGFLLKPFNAEALERLLQEHKPQAAPPSSGSGTQEPVVDAEALARLREMMPETAVKEIYAALVADLARRVAALETAVASGNAAEARRIGHSIKGGCAMAGALQAAHLGAAIEDGALESDGNHLDNSHALLLDLRAAFHNLQRMLEAEFKA
jgi:CheY-like chemotaxis protein